MNLSILFVDDDKNLLEGISRCLFLKEVIYTLILHHQGRKRLHSLKKKI